MVGKGRERETCGAGTFSLAALKTQFGEVIHMSQDIISYNLTSKAITRVAVASTSAIIGMVISSWPS